MSAYAPTTVFAPAALGAACAAMLLAGYALARARPGAASRAAAWGLALGSVPAAYALSFAEPAGFRMLALIALPLLALKAVAAVEARALGLGRLGPVAWLSWAALWPGFRMEAFLPEQRRRLPDAASLVGQGLVRMAWGAALVALARWTWVRTGSWSLALLPLGAGLSLVVHFGLLSVLTGLWHGAGVDVRRPFQAPFRSTSLSELWGRRWNLPFSEMTHRILYRPVAARLGEGWAVGASFLLSGALHELAISLPVRVGFGGPFLYFALHGGLVVLERALARRGCRVDRRPWLGRAWTLAWFVLPVPILFHQPFLREVMLPLIGAQT